MIDSLESATGRAEAGHSPMHNSIGLANVRGRAPEELIAFDYQVECNSRVYREARMARLVEELHHRHLSDCQPVTGQMREHS